MKTAICAGSFDPITLGHLNIIRRASFLFDKVKVCIVVNRNKNSMFTVEERVEQLKKVLARFDNVEVDWWNGLLVNYAEQFEEPVLVRGLRALSDFEYEFQMALINKKISENVETIFLASSEKYTYISSSAVKELASYGADISNLVPCEILSEVVERCLQSNK